MTVGEVRGQLGVGETAPLGELETGSARPLARDLDQIT